MEHQRSRWSQRAKATVSTVIVFSLTGQSVAALAEATDFQGLWVIDAAAASPEREDVDPDSICHLPADTYFRSIHAVDDDTIIWGTGIEFEVGGTTATSETPVRGEEWPTAVQDVVAHVNSLNIVRRRTLTLDPSGSGEIEGSWQRFCLNDADVEFNWVAPINIAFQGRRIEFTIDFVVRSREDASGASSERMWRATSNVTFGQEVRVRTTVAGTPGLSGYLDDSSLLGMDLRAQGTNYLLNPSGLGDPVPVDADFERAGTFQFLSQPIEVGLYDWNASENWGPSLTGGDDRITAELPCNAVIVATFLGMTAEASIAGCPHSPSPSPSDNMANSLSGVLNGLFAVDHFLLGLGVAFIELFATLRALALRAFGYDPGYDDGESMMAWLHVLLKKWGVDPENAERIEQRVADLFNLTPG